MFIAFSLIAFGIPGNFVACELKYWYFSRFDHQELMTLVENNFDPMHIHECENIKSLHNLLPQNGFLRITGRIKGIYIIYMYMCVCFAKFLQPVTQFHFHIWLHNVKVASAFLQRSLLLLVVKTSPL